MAHKYLIDSLMRAGYLTAVVLTGTFNVVAEEVGAGYTPRPESLAVFVVGVGLTGIGFVVRRRLRIKEKG